MRFEARIRKWAMKLHTHADIHTGKQPLNIGFCTWVHWLLQWICQDHDNHSMFTIGQEWGRCCPYHPDIIWNISMSACPPSLLPHSFAVTVFCAMLLHCLICNCIMCTLTFFLRETLALCHALAHALKWITLHHHKRYSRLKNGLSIQVSITLTIA